MGASEPLDSRRSPTGARILVAPEAYKIYIKGLSRSACVLSFIGAWLLSRRWRLHKILAPEGPTKYPLTKARSRAARADRCGHGTVNLAGSGGAYFSRRREDPGRDGRRRQPGARLRGRGRRCLGAPTRDLTRPPSDTSKVEAAPVTPGPVKRVL
ncbi:hypothetical protein NDU88_002992 [Pleurodeles waltl]|uniref:Uncharacterized protein n=1 Tax=Pleurodeles waltl TaxID=8319 RepID=A0AAV7PAT6_PLEWA|nr:hypothetical protein NDU88_002992 [Pleurodeles waltl]